MTRRANKVDVNQQEIMRQLIDAKASVKSLHNVGMGCPDLLVGYRGVNHLIEIKSMWAKKKNEGLTQMQVKFHDDWRGQIAIARTIEEALEIVGIGK